MGESETVMDGRRVEGCESPDGTVKRIHNGNATLAVFSVPASPVQMLRTESVALRGFRGR